MEFMTLGNFVELGTPAILFVVIVALVYLIYMVRGLARRFDSFEESITWKDTCEERHININHRLNRLEMARNGRAVD